MEFFLPPKLKQFVEQKVNEGLYKNPSDIVCEALRALMEKEGLLTRKRISHIREDVQPPITIALLIAEKEMDNDIRMIMEEIRALTSVKERMRELIKELNTWISNEMGQFRSSSHINNKPVRPESEQLQTHSSGENSGEATNHNA